MRYKIQASIHILAQKAYKHLQHIMYSNLGVTRWSQIPMQGHRPRSHLQALTFAAYLITLMTWLS